MSNIRGVAIECSNEYIGIMEQVKHYMLLLLITIRNNSKIPTEEFYKLFDNNWHVYSSVFNDLECGELFIKTAIEGIPGSFKYELTKKGQIRISELVNERSNDIDLNLILHKYNRGLNKVRRPGIFRRILSLFTPNSSRYTKQRYTKAKLSLISDTNAI